MRTLVSRIANYLALTALTVPSTGCLFGNSLYVNIFGNTVTLAASGVDISFCTLDDDNTYRCINNSVFSTFDTLTEPEFVFRVLLLDPLVVQLPAGVTGFSGSFQHNGSSTGGSLAITAGLSSIPVDMTRQLTAEPGMQLVTIGLPDGAPTTGNFDFILTFTVPPGTTSLSTKPILTGFVQLTDNSVFYPPILPCVTSMAAATTFTIPLTVSGVLVPLPPLTADMGCQGVTYNFVPGSATTTTTTLPETCGNCLDDDGNGLVDFEDPACCGGQAPAALAKLRAKLRPRGAGSRMSLKAAPGSLGFAGAPAPRDLFLQIAPEQGGEPYCARVPADRTRAKGKGLRFADPRRTVTSAEGIAGLKLKTKPGGGGVLSLRAKQATLATPAPGALHLAFGLVDPNAPERGATCNAARAEFRKAGKGIRFP